MLIKDIEKILEPFSLKFGQKQDLGTLLIHLRDNGVTADEVIDYIEGIKEGIRAKQEKQSKERDRWNEVALKCPDCKIAMILTSVNTHPSNQVEKGLNSQWVCLKCWYEMFSEKTTADWVKELNKQEAKNG